MFTRLDDMPSEDEVHRLLVREQYGSDTLYRELEKRAKRMEIMAWSGV